MRLKVKVLSASVALIFLFQFQSGAVKRTVAPVWGLCLALFQFQSGAVKSENTFAHFGTPTGFNSKVVRLKATIIKADCMTNMFQFQSGAVKRPFWMTVYCLKK